MKITECEAGQIVRLVDVRGLSRVRGARYLEGELGVVTRVQAHHKAPEILVRFGVVGVFALHPKRVTRVTAGDLDELRVIIADAKPPPGP